MVQAEGLVHCKVNRDAQTYFSDIHGDDMCQGSNRDTANSSSCEVVGYAWSDKAGVSLCKDTYPRSGHQSAGRNPAKRPRSGP